MSETAPILVEAGTSQEQFEQMRRDVMDGKVRPSSDEIPIAPIEPIYQSFAKYFSTLAAADGLQNHNERTTAQLDAVDALAHSCVTAGGNLVALGQR